MKYIITAFLLVTVLFSKAQSTASDSAILMNAEKQGNEMAKQLVTKDYKTFTKSIYPPLLKMTGGEEKMISIIKESMAGMEKNGYSITACTVQRPAKLIHYKNTLQCVVIELLEMKVPGGRAASKSSLIGVSEDGGKKWTFIDTHGASLASIQKSLPGLSNDLVLPAAEKPVLVKD